MARLVIIQGLGIGKRFELVDDVSIVGRHSLNAVSLDDTRVSRRHCEIRKAADHHILKDLGSGNGTLVNGQQFTEGPLRSGDQIQVGETVLIYAVNDTTQSPNSPAANDQQFQIRIDTPNQPSVFLRTVSVEEGSAILSRPNAADSIWLRQQLSILTVLYEATNAIHSIIDVEELLTRILDLLIRTTNADNGCALIRDTESAHLTPMALRTRAEKRSSELVVSRTVAEYVMKERAGVLVSDASSDERFRGGESIIRHQIREVICVPLKGRHDTVGVLFLDTNATQLKPSQSNDPVKFTEDHLRLAVAVAHQAALAIEETKYYQALLQSERLAAIGQTIASLSHHIKNIMQGIRFGSDMVRTAIAETDQGLLLRGWRLVEKNQGKIDDLILDMLGFSKEREPLLETTDLNSLINDVLDVVRGRAADAGIVVEFRPGDSIHTVSCDPLGIHHALLNVVSNAIDALEQCEISGDQPKVTIQIRDTAMQIQILIDDNGPGIPSDKHEEIFKPFVSTKGARGTGLGLPVTRKTLREHGGDATIEPTHSGTRFVLSLKR